MSFPWRQALPALTLPPILLVLCCIACGLLAWRGRRLAGLVGAASALALLLLATPALSGLLRWSLEREVTQAPIASQAPAAIIILGAEATRGPDGPMVGPLTLERLRAGAALHRRMGWPILVTGGVLAPGDPPLARLMALSLAEDFGVSTRWIEARAANTAENAAFSAAMLQAEGISGAYLVSHAWHVPRAMDGFARGSLSVTLAPLSLTPVSMTRMTDWLPRPDHLAESWYALREWGGRLLHVLQG